MSGSHKLGPFDFHYYHGPFGWGITFGVGKLALSVFWDR